ncbi:MAG: hypothetical protein ACRDJC_24055, partial [Thermomicrobiales bacterium]
GCTDPEMLQFDFYNCGSCRTVCSDILEGPWVTCCGGACVDIQEDRNNCGACDNVCETGQECRGFGNGFWCVGGGGE